MWNLSFRKQGDALGLKSGQDCWSCTSECGGSEPTFSTFMICLEGSSFGFSTDERMF